jgi:hypothetical protein
MRKSDKYRTSPYGEKQAKTGQALIEKQANTGQALIEKQVNNRTSPWRKTGKPA